MPADRVARIIADYERGALTDAGACLEVLLAAGEGDAEALFGRLPKALSDLVARDIAGAKPSELRIIESYQGTASPDAHAADRQRREATLRRGIIVLQRITSGRTG
jgi:hypothetical protein